MAKAAQVTVSRVKGPKGSCDRLFSQIVRSIGCCERCGKHADVRELQAAHIIGRGKGSVLRCMTTPITNAWCLCPPCHRETTDYPSEFMKLVKATIGLKTYEELRRLQRETVGTKVDWSEERKRLRRELNEIEALA